MSSVISEEAFEVIGRRNSEDLPKKNHSVCIDLNMTTTEKSNAQNNYQTVTKPDEETDYSEDDEVLFLQRSPLRKSFKYSKSPLDSVRRLQNGQLVRRSFVG